MGSDRLNLLQGREDANKILESSSEGLTVKEIGQKLMKSVHLEITGGRSAYFKHEKHLDKGILQESEDQLDEKFVTPLYTCLMEVDNLNDIVLKFLGSDNHKLMIGEEHLKKIFNEEIGSQMVFNYLLGKFPVKKSVTAAYLKFDFKQSLEECPFIDEIMGIHKSLQVKSLEDNSFRRLKYQINHG
ncbi:uncharacterized protein PGTG_06608 [Puccinia graminis f. sp. tritici CRL 75-36-700-3]|uniref:Uncharacterized protein n=1 Tax=Puccinia graminis f. sp. tritici (strain CRL 75-36-700-3 / race SCCL) TaxID=418459 RepID=E3K8X0_PUCGT|nr:uncharacterized protein PGTG_06608 [Puccinia graminis f. sp. tritici CRL 75-36-700-3]EFP80652.1 hypothetical protein PGTG_06608 [Puccinia graminis f. sp. tritici CRL 75-36-700-3]